jgi:transposase
MPNDLATVYQQAGTPAVIADHYGVPRHTAQGWIRRLKATTAVPDAS